MWTSSLDVGVELIPTSTSQHPVLRMGGEKYGSFYEMTPTRRCPR
jgi:hypothetical protein